MRTRSLGFYAAQMDARSVPLVVITVFTPLGARVYCSSGLATADLWPDPPVEGDVPVISFEPRVVRYGAMRDTGSILPTIFVRGRRAREPGSMEITLRNDDDYFGKLLGQEGGVVAGQANVFLSSRISVAIGYRGVGPSPFLTRFKGVIREQILTREQFTLRAETA